MNRREEEPPWPLPKNWNDRLGGYYPSEEDERREMEEQEEYLRSGYLNDPEHKFKILSHWVGPEIDYPRHFTAEHWDPYENDVLLVRPEPPPPEPPFKRYIVLGLVVWWLFHRFLDWRHRKKMAYRRERDERMAHGIPWWDKRDFKVAYTDVLQNMRARENRWRIRHGYLPLWEDENGDTYELFEWDNYGRPYPPDPTPEEIAREKKRVARLEKRRAWKQKLKDTGEACIFPGALEDLSDPEDFTPGFDDNPEYFELEEEQGRSSDQKVEVVKERETTPQPPGAFPREEPRYLTYHQSYPPYQPPSFYGEPVTVAAVPPAAQPGSKPTPHEKQQENSKQVQAPRVQVQPKSTSSIATRRPATHNDDGEVLPRPPKRRKTTQATDTPRDDHMLIDNEVQDQEYSMEICDPESRGVKRSREDDQEPGSVEGSRKRIKKDTSELPVTSQAKTKAVPSKKRVKNKTTAVAEVQHPLPDPNEPMLAKDGVVSTDPICEGRWIGDVWLGTRWIFRVGMLGRRERLGEMICQSRLPGVFGHMPEKERIQCWVSEQEYAEAKVLGTMDSPTHFCHITVPVEEINEYCWARAAKILRPHPTRFLKKLEPPPPRPKTPPPVIEPPRPVDPLAGILESLPATPNQGTRVFVTLPSARTVASMAREPGLPGLYPTPDLHTSKSPSRIPHIPKAELPRTKSSAKSISSSSRQRDKSKPKERSKPRREPIVIDDDDIDVTDSVVIPPTKEQAFVQTEPAISMRPTDNSAPLVNEHASQPIPTAPIVIVEMATQTYTSESPATLPSTSPTEETSQAVSTGDIALRTAPRPKSMSKRARLERISTQISSVPSKLSPSEAMNEARRKLANKPARPSPLSQCITAEPAEPQSHITAPANTSPQTTDTSPTSSDPSDSTPVPLSQRSSFVAPVTPSSSSPQSPFDLATPVVPSNHFSSGTNEMTPHTPALQDNYGGAHTRTLYPDQAYGLVIINSVEDSSMMMDIVDSPPPSKVEFSQYTEPSTFNLNPAQTVFQSLPATLVEPPTQGLFGPPLSGFGNAPSTFVVAETLNGSSTTGPVGFPAPGYSPTPGTNGHWFASSSVLESSSMYTPTDAHHHSDHSRRPPPGTSHNNRVFKNYKRLQKSTPIPGQPTGNGNQQQWEVIPPEEYIQVSMQPSPQLQIETAGPSLTFTHFAQGQHQQSPPQQQQQYSSLYDPNQSFRMQM